MPLKGSKGSLSRPAVRMSRSLAGIILLTCSFVYAGSLLSSSYNLSVPVLVNGGGDVSSLNYKVRAGIIGRDLSGSAQSSGYKSSSGFEAPAYVISGSAAADLSDAYVYPNPFKPNSPGRFQSEKITFKHLPADVTIRIFAITGKRVAEFHKTDETSDIYEWNPVNSAGKKLASGVYLYFMTTPAGGKAKGKFAVIR